LPAAQLAHSVGDVELPGDVCSVPAAHAPCAVQLERLALAVYVPGAHAAQLRFVVVDGVFETKLPAEQVLQGEHEPALVAAFQVPLLHVTQLRSVVALPAALTASPAPQLRQVLQLGAFALALKVPLAQVLQARLAVAEPSLLTN